MLIESKNLESMNEKKSKNTDSQNPKKASGTRKENAPKNKVTLKNKTASKNKMTSKNKATLKTSQASLKQSEIRKTLSKKTIAITGATGFLGTALVEKLLRSVPDCSLLLLVRPGKRGAARRIETEIFNNDAFSRLKLMHKSEITSQIPFQKILETRVTALAADITKDDLGMTPADLKLLATADIFIHSAAAVSFTSTLDDAIETNLLGPVRILETLKQLKEKHRKFNPHLIAISTAYVAGSKKGLVPEKLLQDLNTNIADIDIDAEIEFSRRAKASTEDKSRSNEILSELEQKAKRDLGGAAGTTALSKRKEQMRRTWVKDKLVEMGRSRAASLGFPDIYGLTKAMAETKMCEMRGDIPLSIVRPSIIESALAEPFSGWIRGFRMAEPIIISYARGLLKDFPAKPDGVLDVIPVDLVVAAICAVAAVGQNGDVANEQKEGKGNAAEAETSTKPEVVNVASGSLNPFLFRDLHNWCHDWFTLHPVYDENDIPIAVSKWSYPSRNKVAQQLKRTKRALSFADSVVRKLPIRGAQAEAVAGLEENLNKLSRVEGYLEQYGKYLECQAIFGTAKLVAMSDSLPTADQKEFAFDPRVIDWHTYLTEIHLPSVLIQGRVKTKPTQKIFAPNLAPNPIQNREENSPNEDSAGAHLPSSTQTNSRAANLEPTDSPLSKSRRTKSERLRKAVLAPERTMAVFDLENTMIASNVVSAWGWLSTRHLSGIQRFKLVAGALLEAPRLLAMDGASREDFLVNFYRRYKGARADEMEANSQEMFSELLLAKSFPAAIARIRKHRSLGHTTILITGTLDFVVEPFRPLFDEIICAELQQKNGKYTGTLKSQNPTGELRAEMLREYGAANGLSLNDAVVYADAVSDLPLLEAVGFPVAVNPEVKLASIARRRGWLIENFAKADEYGVKLLPTARFVKERPLSVASRKR